jgi:ribosomal protein L11 methyltransferase
MDYCELSFSCVAHQPSEIVFDLLSSSLCEIGFDSFERKNDILLGYIPSALYNRSAVQICIDQLPLEGVKIQYTEKMIEDEDWNAVWEQDSFKPISIEGKCLIRPLSFKPDRNYIYNVVIDPKMAFGTGFHETTRMMITWLLQSDVADKEVLDMGCGTGVLAILARMMDAEHVIAIDNDQRACQNAERNITLNHLDSIDVIHGDAGSLSACGTFHIVLANINRNILLHDMDHYAAVMKKEAYLFLSGFLKEDLEIVEEGCRKSGLIPLEHKEENGWISLKVTKP